MAWLILVGLIVAVGLAALWLYRRWDKVDSYYEREQNDPPATDITTWFGGGRGQRPLTRLDTRPIYHASPPPG